jgi:hypothetical protein
LVARGWAGADVSPTLYRPAIADIAKVGDSGWLVFWLKHKM